jgi:DNA modification methylase
MKDLDLFGEVLASDEPLRRKFGSILPFSVLDTKTADWTNRKQLWLDLGIQSELGRDEDLMGFGRVYSKGNARLFADRKTSVFDPVLTELMYKWFNIEGGTILDPFAGGSVRGIVSNYLGYDYTGIDIRPEQVVSNQDQAKDILSPSCKFPNWMVGDSKEELNSIEDGSFDMVFTCPPYFDLEKYSDEAGDISNMDYESFKDAYSQILRKSCEKLKDNRFFVVVIGDVRDKDRTINWYRNLIGFTKDCVIDSGLHLYNEIIMLDKMGTSAMRVDQAFSKRKLVKIHQNIYVFYKGVNVNDIRDEYNK